MMMNLFSQSQSKLDATPKTEPAAAPVEIVGIRTPATTPTSTHIENLVGNVQSLPLWMKQVLFIVLKSDLQVHLSNKTLNSLSKDNFVQLWQPSLSTQGIKALFDEKEELKEFLALLKDKKSVYLVCFEKHLTLEQFCSQLLVCLDKKLIDPPENTQVLATMEYLGNRTRIGDYLVRLGRISTSNLEDALKTQKYISVSTGEQVGIGEILIRLNLVTQQDVESILFLKQQASQAFQLHVG